MEAKRLEEDDCSCNVLTFSPYFEDGVEEAARDRGSVSSEQMARMQDVTFAPVSYSQFVEEHNSFLVRTELEGVQVCLLKTQSADRYVVAVFVDRKQLYSDTYRCSYGEAFQEYMGQVRYVRNLFVQSGRKEIFYFMDKDGSVGGYYHS